MIEHFFICPYCWQSISILLDAALEYFEGIEDCEVCCRPIEVEAWLQEGEVIDFRMRKAQ